MFKVTLKKGVTYRIDRYRFLRGEPQIVADNTARVLIGDPAFVVEDLNGSYYKTYKRDLSCKTCNFEASSYRELWLHELSHENLKKKRKLKALNFSYPYKHHKDGYGVSTNWLEKEFLKRKIKLSARAKIKLIYNAADKIKRDRPGQILVGFTMFESTKIFRTWVEGCNRADIMLYPSLEVQRTFEKCGVKTKGYIVPLGVSENFNYIQRPKKNEFVFLIYGQLGIWNRKGWKELCQAFTAEFKQSEPVRLMIKSSIIDMHNLNCSFLANRQITWIAKDYSEEEMKMLLSYADCFVYCSHGEGFGLPPLEAMATGLPVIAADFMGMSQWIDEKSCYPLKVKRLCLATYYPEMGDVGYWADIDIKKLRYLMRYIYENYSQAKEKGKLASEYVNKNYRYKFTVDRIIKILESL